MHVWILQFQVSRWQIDKEICEENQNLRWKFRVVLDLLDFYQGASKGLIQLDCSVSGSWGIIHLVRTQNLLNQWVRNVSFSEYFMQVLNEQSPVAIIFAKL